MAVQPSLRKIGKYVVTDVIGTGGMGIVYRAQDPTLERTVAIKMLRQSEAGSVFNRFFLREMKSTGSLHHKNIVTVFDSGEHEGSPYLVMECLDGEPVSKLISERRPLTLLEKLEIIVQVCDGLQYAHDRGLIHRDIKPANVIVLKDGAAKIVDFGVARAGGETSIIQTGHVVGSLYYMSPEQVNSVPLDARSDIFSTGVLLYEFLTYEIPFKGTDASSTFMKILQAEPPPLSQYLKDVPAELQTVLNRALAKNVIDRYQSAQDFSFDLLNVQAELKSAIVADSIKRAESAVNRNDFERAWILLLEVTRIDRQNERANRMLRDLRNTLQRKQRSSQIIQMRSQAQVALTEAQYEEALACASQALQLDPSDEDSIRLCEDIRNTITRVKAVREAITRSEAALVAGDFDEAKDCIEESLRLDPSDAEARALALVVNKEIAERSRRQRIQEFVDLARRDIAERKFTDALDALRHAEELDPSDSNVRELLQWAQRGQEQENKRRVLQEITDQIEKALHAGEFSSAWTISEMGLQRFPEEPMLLRLRTISEKQRDIAERRRFVNDKSIQVRSLTDQGKLAESVQELTEALKRYPGEPNFESLLASTKAEIERQRTEREAVARQKAIQQAEAEARARTRQRVLDLSIELRRCLDAHTRLADISKWADELRSTIQGKKLDEQSSEVAALLLSEVDARIRSRDQAVSELDQVRDLLNQSRDSASMNEAENRLSSIKAAFPSETKIQQICSQLEDALLRVREDLERAISSLTSTVSDLELTAAGDLLAVQQRAREMAAAFAADPRVGALMQQVDSFVTRRLERNAELGREMTELLKELAGARSLVAVAHTVDRARSIAGSDKTDRNIADCLARIEAEAQRVRGALEELLQEMASVARAAAEAPTVHAAEALIPQVRALADAHAEFRDLQDAANRVFTQIQGRRIEHDLVVHELESVRSSLWLLETDDELAAAVARADECQKANREDETIVEICGRLEADVTRILREREDVRKSNLECDNALRLSEDLLQQGDLDGALGVLQPFESRASDRIDLRLQLSIVRKAVEQEREERERLEQEKQEKEKAEGEAQARRTAIEDAIREAAELIAIGKGEEAQQRITAELERYPESEQLQSELEVIQLEVERLQAEKERLAQELAEARIRARRVATQQVLHEAAQLQDRRSFDEAWQILVTALDRDPENQELQAAANLAIAKADAARAEKERLEKERAETEARVRQEACDRALLKSSELLSLGKSEQALQVLRSALERDPENQQLLAELESTQAEVAREREERERKERERLESAQAAKEHAELDARLRREAARQAIQQAQRLLASGQGEEAIQNLRKAIEKDPENQELKSTLESMQAAIAKDREERKRLESERVAKEKAAAEARARQAAANEAIQQSRSLLSNGQEEEAIDRLQRAVNRDPENGELRAFLESTQTEVSRQREARERQERERLAKEKAEAEARARQVAAEQAIRVAQELQEKGAGDEALVHLQTALRQDPQNQKLRAALEGTKAKIEQQREEAERREREEIARKKAEQEARARQAAIDQAVVDAQEMLARGQDEASLQHLQQALKRYPNAPELRSTLGSAQVEVDRRRAERERLEQERVKQERAEAELKVRGAAIAEALRTAKSQLEQGLADKSAQGIRAALKRYPDSVELQAALQGAETEAARLREERERAERERIAREQAEAKERAREAAANEAIQKAQRLLAKGQGDDAVQCLRAAMERDRQSKELGFALQSTQAEIARRRSEREREERERVAKEESARRARKQEIDKALQLAGKLHADGKSDEALQLLRGAVKRFPDSQELRSAVNAVQEDINRLRAEKQRAAELEAKAKAAEKAKAAAAAKAAGAKTVVMKKPAPGSGEEVDGAFADRRRRMILIGSIAAGVVVVVGIIGLLIARGGRTSNVEVAISLNPADATLKIDGKPEPCDGRCTLSLSSKDHRVDAEKPGYIGESIVAKPTDRALTISLVPIERHPALLQSSLSITSDGAVPAPVSLDGSHIGDLSTQPLQLKDLKPGAHQITITENGGSVDLSVTVSPDGAVRMENARGLDQNPVVAMTRSADGQEIFCRCDHEQIRVEGRKIKGVGRNRYVVSGKEPAASEVALLRDGQPQQVGSLGVDPNYLTIFVASSEHSTGYQPPLPEDVVAWKKIENSHNPGDFLSFYTRFSQSQFAKAAFDRGADLAWESIRGSDKSSDFQTYLSSYSGSSHAQEANARLVALTPKPPPPPPVSAAIPEDVAEWSGIKNTRDLNVLRNFRDKYRNSPKATDAFVRMAEIEWDGIHNSSRPEEFQDFMNKYPNTAHWAEAKSRNDELIKDRSAAEAQAEAQKRDQQREEQLQRDREAVKQSLERYRLAYQNKDFNALAQVWPSVPRAQFQQTFKVADKISVKLDPQQPAISGDAATATVQCIQTVEFVSDGKKQKQAPQSRLFRLQRVDGKWIIQTDN